MGGRKGVTIRDVARRAGVSISAVSMALNDTGTLSAATRARVRAVAASMEYGADSLARGLRGASVGVIGVVVRSLDALGEYAPSGVDVFARYIGAVSSQAMDRGLSVMLVPDPTRRPSPPLALSLDGYIVLAPHRDDPVVALLERRQIPYVTLGRDLSRPDFTDWASENDEMIIPGVLNHFAAGGARSVVLVVGTDPNAWNADAERLYLESAKDSPSPEVYCGLFDLYKAQGAGRVLDALDKAVGDAAVKGVEPADASAASRALAMLQVVRGDRELVKELLIQANQRLRFSRGLAFQTRLLLAALAARTHQLGTAEDLYRSCLDSAGDLNRGNEQEVYFGLLRVLMLAHKYDEVVTIATRGLKNEATLLAPLYEDLAIAQMALGRTAEALESADEVVRKAEDAASRLRYRLFRAEMLSQAGKHTEASAECLSLLKEYNAAGDAREIRMVLSMVYSTAHDRAKSEEQLELVLKADPGDATANNDLGYQWADSDKNLDEAERMIRKALDLDHKQRTTGAALVLDGDQDNASYVDSLGWVLFRKGKLAEARAELERAVSLQDGSDSPEVWDHLGDIYFRSEMPAKAGEAWGKAVSLYQTTRRRPDDRLPEIQEKLRLLKP